MASALYRPSSPRNPPPTLNAVALFVSHGNPHFAPPPPSLATNDSLPYRQNSNRQLLHPPPLSAVIVTPFLTHIIYIRNFPSPPSLIFPYRAKIDTPPPPSSPPAPSLPFTVCGKQLTRRTQIDIYLHMIQSDGGALPVSVNAASLALVDAGVAMSDLVVACSAGYLDGMPVMVSTRGGGGVVAVGGRLLLLA